MRSNKKLLNLLVESKNRSSSPMDCVNQTIEGNLFQQCKSEKSPSIVHFNPNRSYEFVGVKELKSYCERLRNPKHSSKRYTPSKNMVRMSSLIKKTDHQNALLSRIELLNMTAKTTNNDHSRLMDKTNWNDRSNCVCSSMHQTSMDETQYEFSLQKVKNSHRMYQDVWSKAEEEGEKKKKGFPSLIRLTTEEREKREVVDKLALKHLKENIHVSNWEQQLRSSENNLKQFYGKKHVQQPIIRRNLMSLTGKNKLQRETEWVNSKGEQGYRFKFMSNLKQE